MGPYTKYIDIGIYLTYLAGKGVFIRNAGGGTYSILTHTLLTISFKRFLRDMTATLKLFEFWILDRGTIHATDNAMVDLHPLLGSHLFSMPLYDN